MVDLFLPIRGSIQEINNSKLCSAEVVYIIGFVNCNI